MAWYQFYYECLKNAFSNSLGISQAVAFLSTLCCQFLQWKIPSIKNRVKKIVWQIPLIVLIFTIVIGLIISPYKVFKQHQEKESNRPISFATPDALIGSRLEGLDFRIVDLAREDLLIQNRTIVNCRIYGPAVILPISCSFRNITFSGIIPDDVSQNIKSIYVPIPDTEYIQGIIRIENVDFRDCEFKKISMMGTKELKSNLLDNFEN